MTRPYDNIPRAGGPHEKPIDEEHSGMNVRAPRPSADPASEKEGQPLQIFANESTGCYRFRSGADRPGDEGFTSLCSVDSGAGIAPALEQIGEGPFWVVLENSDTGEVFYEADYNLSDNWSDGGRFDSVTLFPSEDEAASYADERQASTGD
jgi:hypothetical protein